MTLSVALLAAGKGTRLKSDLPKVLHPLFGKPLIGWVLEAALSLSPAAIYPIVGHGRDQVETYLASYPVETTTLQPVVQDPPRGTGHAVQQLPLQAWQGTLLILAGDVPLIRPETLQTLVRQHRESQAQLTVLTAQMTNPTGYGRILSDAQGQPLGIVEEKDASPEQKAIQSVNTGVFCLEAATIAPLLNQLQPNNAQGELYLTDLVALAYESGLRTQQVALADPQEMTGVNTRQHLAQCHQILNQRTLDYWMDHGVTFLDPLQTWISPQARFGTDCLVYPGCLMEGPVVVGNQVTLGPHTVLKGNTVVGDRSWVSQSLVVNSCIGERGLVGPFAHLRDEAVTDSNVKVGNFVELKNAQVGADSFVSHLAYVGDATLGQDVNWGAGSITANYNHLTKVKARTEVADHASIGSNCVLVAPVAIGQQAVIGAGSVITKPVSAQALGLARAKQTEIADWAVIRKMDIPVTTPS